MSVYMEPLIDDLLRTWEEEFGHTIELQRQTLECMFGTIIPYMTCRRMGYSAAGVFMGSSLA